MSDILRDTYGPWPSDSEPKGMDDDTARALADAGYMPMKDYVARSAERQFTISILGEDVDVKLTIHAAESLAEALEKAAGALRR